MQTSAKALGDKNLDPLRARAFLLRNGLSVVKDLARPPKNMIYVFPEETLEAIVAENRIKNPTNIAYVEGIIKSRPVNPPWRLIFVQQAVYFWDISLSSTPEYRGGQRFKQIEPNRPSSIDFYVHPDYCLVGGDEVYRTFTPNPKARIEEKRI